MTLTCDQLDALLPEFFDGTLSAEQEDGGRRPPGHVHRLSAPSFRSWKVSDPSTAPTAA